MSECARLRCIAFGQNWIFVEDILRVADGFLDMVQARVHQDSFELSHHAQREAAAEQISVDDIKHAMLTGQELGPYPDDPRGPSCLLVGQDTSGRWLHVLCGNFDRTNVLIITVYLPQPPKWQDAWTRRVNP
jgi:hypothetical protein